MLSPSRFEKANGKIRDPEKALRLMPPRDATSAERGRAWGSSLDAELKRRKMRNVDLKDAIDALGLVKYSATTISEWRKGAAAPSETACMIVARALRQPLAVWLRAGGYPDAAHVNETQIPDDDPRLTRIRAADLAEQDAAVLEDELRARIADLDDLFDLKLRRLTARPEPKNPDSDEEDGDRGAS
jgi:hypothetical protein